MNKSILDLLENKKYNVIFVYLSLIIFSTYYIYNTNMAVQKHMIDTKIDGITTHYNFYNLISKQSIQLKNISVKNPRYIDTDDLVDEYSQSTPFYVDKKDKKTHQYDIKFRYFTKKFKHTLEIENKISKLKNLQNQEYFCEITKNSIYLFGMVSNKGYVLIEQYLIQTNEVKNILNAFFIKIIIIGIINIIAFFYLLYLISNYKLHQEHKDKEFECLKEETKKIALVDTLTGAATRLKFDMVLEDLISLASRFKEQKFTVTLIDIDNFKIVNDTHGHDYGDIVLQQVATVIKNNIRESDTFARWGGEEFVIISPLSCLENSYKHADKIRELIANIKFEKLEQITCSFGISIFEKYDNEKTIIKRADELLYLAKENGKNRIQY